ncbi:MAG: hypothetical protein A3H91_02650 [Gammaproteobacteria bacterium RIFCSPLOWO2_02_FULL_61_13]|nr:MAG: hypothetical protein A3H91_02650 [Gammaproteobacteria bacterium RIFCSPLOWO2_02_FULL_61_13]
MRITLWTVVTVSLIAMVVAAMHMQTRVADIVVYKSPTCGCCTKWIEHLRRAGFAVDAVDTGDLEQIKRSLGVPMDLASCHTAVVGEYLVEGHVPADLVRRLQQERPRVRGLAVPSMPPGSPGMEHPNPVRYDVLAFGTDGKISVYATRQGGDQLR